MNLKMKTDYMKTFKRLALAALLIGATPLFQSCLNADDTDGIVICPEGGVLAIGTIKVPDAETPREFYFALDNGVKLFPGDTTAIKGYPIVNDQRIFVGYLRMGELISDYDVNGQIFSIENILTKEIVPLTKENADSIGNDPINLTTKMINDEFLTLEYQYLSTMDKEKKHMLNLVENQTESKDSEEEYVCLEFRHNAFGDNPQKVGTSIISFKLNKIKEQMKGKKGLKIRVKTIYDGVQDYKINF